MPDGTAMEAEGDSPVGTPPAGHMFLAVPPFDRLHHKPPG